MSFPKCRKAVRFGCSPSSKARQLAIDFGDGVGELRSFLTDGMIVVPCSMRTPAAIAHGFGDTLVHRAADVILKERRKLVLSVRETPFNDIHLENMLKLSRMGAVICPPMPAYYTRPQTVDEIVTWSAARLLDQVGIHVGATSRWDGEMEVGTEP